MKITALETIQLGEFPNLIWLQLHTDEGIVGLGETFYGTAAVAAYLHETAAPRLIGKDPLQIDRAIIISDSAVPGPRCAGCRWSTSRCGTSSVRP